jgi:molybdopterin-guanine dinucleotide biosynthesis protein A
MGIFVGGNSTRMGGQPKGMLRCPNDSKLTLVDHWRKLAIETGIESVLVGERSDYASLGLHTVRDNPPGVGPIGGLHAFLMYCQLQGTLGAAVACDMPFVSYALLGRLCTTPSDRPVLAPRHAESQRWEPLFARYEPSRSIPVIQSRLSCHQLSLQAVITMANGEVLPLTPEEWSMLKDWDKEQDVALGQLQETSPKC